MAPIEDGVLWPSKTALYSAMALQSELNGRMLEIIRELAGSAHDHAAILVARLREPGDRGRRRALHALGLDRRESQGGPDAAAWDFIGSEFGSRHQQYEKFYGGASFLVKQNVYRNFDFKRATALVDAALNLPPIAP